MLKKKLIALAAAALMLAGCSNGADTRVAATYNGKEVPAGVYLYYLVDAYEQARYQVPDFEKSVLKQDIDGVKAADWIVAEAQQSTRAFAAIESESERLGVTLSDENTAALRASLDQAWEQEGPAMEQNGIARTSVDAIAMNSQKAQQLFDKYYGEGGETPISDAELEQYYRENYRRVLYLAIPKYDAATGELLTGDALTAREAEIEDYYNRAVGGEKLFDLIVEHDKKLHEGGEEHTHGDLVESQQEAFVPKVSSSYATLFLDQLFAGESLNTIERYDNGDYEMIYERRDLMGDGSHFAASKEGLRRTLKGETFYDDMAAKADGLGFAFNDKAVKRYTADQLIVE